MSDKPPDVSTTDHPKLTPRFDDAMVFAAHAHRRQVRKNTGDVPYISHLMSVAALVLEAGGDEDLAIAALLHDAAEDQGGEEMLMRIRERFGPRVERIVRGCSDTFELPKPPWTERKLAYLAHLRDEADLDICMVSAADKIHNARCILTDHHQFGDDVFARFRAGDDIDSSKRNTLWYYRELVTAFQVAADRNAQGDEDRNEGLGRLLKELERVINVLEEQARVDRRDRCRG